MIQQYTSQCRSGAKFSEQSLVTFVETKHLSKINKALPILEQIEAFLSFERNFECGQIYLTQELETSGHCTIKTVSVPKFMELPLHNKVTGRVPFLHVPSTANYMSPDSKIVVINTDNKEIPFHESSQDRRPPIETATNIITEMFHHHLSECFEFSNKKRSTSMKKSFQPQDETTTTNDTHQEKTKTGKRKRRCPKHTGGGDKHVVRSSFERSALKEVSIDPNALPVVSLGWSMTDCNRYGENVCSMGGNVRPFLLDGNLSKQARVRLCELIEFITKILPPEWTFNVRKCNCNRTIDLRLNMIAEFKEMLGGNNNTEFFRVEGITILIPLSIGYHKDTLNCSLEGMTSVISINARIPLNKNTIPSGPGSKLWIWLEKNGYTDFFPCSIILYSRKCVHSFCAKMAATELFAERDLVRRCIKWAIIDRVGSVVDYRSRVWNNNNFPNLFRKYSTKKKGSRFGGLLWSSPAAFDKTVS